MYISLSTLGEMASGFDPEQTSVRGIQNQKRKGEQRIRGRHPVGNLKLLEDVPKGTSKIGTN